MVQNRESVFVEIIHMIFSMASNVYLVSSQCENFLLMD